MQSGWTRAHPLTEAQNDTLLLGIHAIKTGDTPNNSKNEKQKVEDYFILFVLKIELRHIWPSSRLQGCIVTLLV